MKNEILKRAEQIVETENLNGQHLGKFWSKNKAGQYKILMGEMQQVMATRGGFWKYRTEDKQARIVRIENSIVDLPTTEEIKSWIIQYVNLNFPVVASVVNETIKASHEKLFSKGALEFMPDINLNMLEHGPKVAYYPFKNGILKITPEEKILIPYNEVNMYVWKSHIIDHDYDQEMMTTFVDGDFFRFVTKICNDDPERIVYASSIIGYLLHTYKDKARPYAVILAEEVESDEDGGGTGKGIFFRAISKIINTIVVDGKSFKADKAFLFQRANIDTRLIVIDDCRKNIDFQSFYSHISEGLTIEKKNKDEIHIPYKESPKFMFSTNYTINIDGNHGRRRTRIVEFSNFFNSKNSPLDYFGHMLFDDWNTREWNEFYSTMALFIQNYLQDGMNEPPTSQSFIRKEISNRYTADFLEFYDSIPKGEAWDVLSDVYAKFITEYSLDKKDYSARRFHMAVGFAAKKMDQVFESRKNSLNGGKKDFRIMPKLSGIEKP